MKPKATNNVREHVLIAESSVERGDQARAREAPRTSVRDVDSLERFSSRSDRTRPRRADSPNSLPPPTPRPLRIALPSGGQTTDVALNALADRVAERLARGDARGVLDVVYGKRGVDDPNFAVRLLDAVRENKRLGDTPMMRAASMAQLDNLSGAEQTILRSYLANPGGTSLPSDIAAAALSSPDADIDTLRSVYDSLAIRYDAENAPDSYRDAVRAMEDAYANRPPARLFSQPWPREESTKSRAAESAAPRLLTALDRAARREVLASKLRCPDVTKLYDATGGRLIGHDGDAVLTLLLRNLESLDDLGTNYARVIDPRPKVTGVARLLKLTQSYLTTGERRRAALLLDTERPAQARAIDYARATLASFRAGAVSNDLLTSTFRSLTRGPRALLAGAALPIEIAHEARSALATLSTAEPQADAGIVTLLTGLASASNIAWDSVAAASVLDALKDARGSRDALLAVASRLDTLEPDEREAVRAAFHTIDLDTYRHFGRSTIADHGIVERLTSAANNVNNGATELLRGATLAVPTARPSDAVRAIRAIKSGRGELPSRYDETYGVGAFDRALERLPENARRQIRVAVALPAASSSASPLDTMRARVDQLRVEETRGFGGELVNVFGASGAVLGDTARRIATTMNALSAIDETQPPEAQDRVRRQFVRELAIAYRDFSSAIESAADDRAALADNAELAATLVVGMATAGGGLSVAAIARAATSVGVSSVASRYAVLGDRYDARSALSDFLSNAGLELGALSATKTASAVLRPLLDRVHQPQSKTLQF